MRGTVTEHTTETSTWTKWSFTQAEFLEKLGLPPEANLIQVQVSFAERSVTVVAAGNPEKNGVAP